MVIGEFRGVGYDRLDMLGSQGGVLHDSRAKMNS